MFVAESDLEQFGQGVNFGLYTRAGLASFPFVLHRFWWLILVFSDLKGRLHRRQLKQVV